MQDVFQTILFILYILLKILLDPVGDEYVGIAGFV